MNRNVLRQAQELQAKLAKAQQELADMTVEVSSGGGAVSVTGADAATLIIAAASGDNHAAKCRRSVASAVRKTYPQLLGDHLSVKPD